MLLIRARYCLLLIAALLSASVWGQAAVLHQDNFISMDRWIHGSFPKIDQHTDYRIVMVYGQNALQASADASASYLRFDTVYSLRDYPLLRWSWLVESVYENGDGTRKSGDDFPLRVYVIFEYEPEQAKWSERLLYSAARLVYGEYPPHSALSYVWESRGAVGRVIINPYSDKARQIVLRSGPASPGEWQEEAVNVLEDYRRVFGSEPPERATLAIMSDADNTGEATVAYIRFIQITAE